MPHMEWNTICIHCSKWCIKNCLFNILTHQSILFKSIYQANIEYYFLWVFYDAIKEILIIWLGIIIRFLGEANTSWNEIKKVRDDQGKEHDETEELTGHEEYFSNSYYLLGAKNGSEIILPAGEHVHYSCFSFVFYFSF